LYSDGVTDCENSGGQLLDEDGLTRIVKTHSQTPGPEFATDLMWELQSFSGKVDQADDISALIFDFAGKS
jgi:sigma-B regulation protein RsbU (phosphoserine phosphatase)